MQTLKVVRHGRVQEPAIHYTTPDLVQKLLHKRMHSLDREHFMVLHLNSKNCLIGQETISIGSLNQSITHPREVFKAAVINGSAAVILAHNHPSGDPFPSDEDRAITARLREVGELIGIKVLDHIILGSDGYFSFVEMETAVRIALEVARRGKTKGDKRCLSLRPMNSTK